MNTQAGFRDAVEGTGASADWLVPKEKADEIRSQLRAQQAAAQRAAALGHIGEQAGKIAMAAKNTGDAGAALKQAGLA